MKRFLTLIAAVASSAAVTAAITLPAGASDQTNPKDAPFVACLRDHGLAIPADTTGDAIKGWLLAHEHADDAVAGCKPDNAGDPMKVDHITACLRGQGLNPPTDPDQLKPWLAQHEGDAGVKACGFDAPVKADHGDKPGCTPAGATAAKRRVDAAKPQ